MHKPNTVPTSILSVLAVTALFIFAAVSHVGAGAPLKSGDVKLGKNPGGGAAARTTTDNAGHFTFPVVAAGSYTITMERPADAGDAAIVVSVKGAAGGAITKTFDGATKSTARTKAAIPIKIDVKSDGKTPLSGNASRQFNTLSNASKN